MVIKAALLRTVAGCLGNVLEVLLAICHCPPATAAFHLTAAFCPCRHSHLRPPQWYDFVVFGMMAPYVSPLFFPNVSPSAALLQTFAVFGSAFIARPLGGVLLGVVG